MKIATLSCFSNNSSPLKEDTKKAGNIDRMKRSNVLKNIKKLFRSKREPTPEPKRKENAPRDSQIRDNPIPIEKEKVVETSPEPEEAPPKPDELIRDALLEPEVNTPIPEDSPVKTEELSPPEEEEVPPTIADGPQQDDIQDEEEEPKKSAKHIETITVTEEIQPLKPAPKPEAAKIVVQKKPKDKLRYDNRIKNKPIKIEYPKEIPRLEISKIPIKSSPKPVPAIANANLKRDLNTYRQDNSKLIELAKITPKTKIRPPKVSAVKGAHPPALPTTEPSKKTGPAIMIKPTVTSQGLPHEPRIINGPDDSSARRPTHENVTFKNVPSKLPEPKRAPRSIVQPGFAANPYKTTMLASK